MYRHWVTIFILKWPVEATLSCQMMIVTSFICPGVRQNYTDNSSPQPLVRYTVDSRGVSPVWQETGHELRTFTRPWWCYNGWLCESKFWVIFFVIHIPSYEGLWTVRIWTLSYWYTSYITLLCEIWLYLTMQDLIQWCNILGIWQEQGAVWMAWRQWRPIGLPFIKQGGSSKLVVGGFQLIKIN